MTPWAYFLGADLYETRVCAYCDPGRSVGESNYCGEEALIHLFWNLKGKNSYICKDHAEEVVEQGKWYRWHPMGPYCGMPGAFFIPLLNFCGLDPSGIPVAEKKGGGEPRL